MRGDRLTSIGELRGQECESRSYAGHGRRNNISSSEDLLRKLRGRIGHVFRTPLKRVRRKRYSARMKYEIQESEARGGGFLVSAIQSDGEVCSALFSGPRAKERAEEYAAWKNRGDEEPKSAPQSR